VRAFCDELVVVEMYVKGLRSFSEERGIDDAIDYFYVIINSSTDQMDSQTRVGCN